MVVYLLVVMFVFCMAFIVCLMCELLNVLVFDITLERF